jgi:cbb3-type cytochrome oxidase subunit 1
LYAVSSIYDPITKKVTGKILGSITEANGFVGSVLRVLSKKAEKYIYFSAIAIKKQGFSSFINLYFQQQIHKLKTFFFDDWEQIVAITYCRMAFHSPIKNMPFNLEISTLTNELNFVFTDKKISILLNSIGQKRETVVDFMKSFIQ